MPGSKSESSRALVLAALAGGQSLLTGLSTGRDTNLMMRALNGLGVAFTRLPAAGGSTALRVRPSARLHPVPAGIDCGLAGTVMRFVPAVAALARGRTAFFGDPRATERPIAPLLTALAQLGVRASGSRLPFTLTAPGRLGGPEVTIDASASSQFVSALLLLAPRLPNGIRLRHVGMHLPSLPHIQMTVTMLRARGVRVDDSLPGQWLVTPGPIAALDQPIQPDLTNAAVFLAAGVLSGGRVGIPGWPRQTDQPGDHFRDILHLMGARVEFTGDVLFASGTGPLRGASLDLSRASELTPVVAALAGFASGTTTITGIGHIRGHETDRLTAIAAELGSLGVPIRETSDGLVISGRPANRLRPTRTLHSHGDHRLAHLAALTGLLVPGVRLDDIGCVAKTMPDFTERWQAMLDQSIGPAR